MKSVLISLIIPTHCRANLLRRALDSVISQNKSNLIEIILISDVTDTSTDIAASEWLRPHDIYVRRNGKAGPSESRNLGLRMASGKYVMFLDDDDAWHPEFIETLEKSLSQKKSDNFYMNCVVVKESRQPSGPIKLEEIFFDLKNQLTEQVYVKNQVHMSCYMFERNILSGLYFDTNLKAYEDWDFQLSAISKSEFTHLPIVSSIIHEVDDITTDRRGSSEHASNFNATLDYLYIYRRHKSPNEYIKNLRSKLLATVGLNIYSDYL